MLCVDSGRGYTQRGDEKDERGEPLSLPKATPASVKFLYFSSLPREVLGSAPSKEQVVAAESAGEQSLIQQAFIEYLRHARARHTYYILGKARGTQLRTRKLQSLPSRVPIKGLES